MGTSNRKYRPKCYICGRFIDKNGHYDVFWDDWNGAWEEGYTTCSKHTKRNKDNAVVPDMENFERSK